MVASVLTIPVHGAEGDTAIPVISETPKITPAETPVRELRVEGNKISYYYKGKMVRNKWKRYEGYKHQIQVHELDRIYEKERRKMKKEIDKGDVFIVMYDVILYYSKSGGASCANC